LDRYALASHSFSRETGERRAKEAGQSVEFRDFRPYQHGDELRYVDWRAYARSGRLYTRLYQAERSVAVYLLLDTSSSMALGHKAAYARTVASLLCYVAQRDARAEVHLFNRQHSRTGRGRAGIQSTWSFIDKAPSTGDVQPISALKDFALTTFAAGAGLVLVVSDLFDEAPLEPALTALRARGLDASFLQVIAQSDLEPQEGQLEVMDAELGGKLRVGPAEVRAYREAVREFVRRSRSAILRAGFRHALLRVPIEEGGLEQAAFSELIRAGVLQRR
jgi:uncharacterized protein (DUF58 family)